MRNKLWLTAMTLALCGSVAFAMEEKKDEAKSGAPMACCVNKYDCCKDKKPCCSMKEGEWGEKGGKDGKEGRRDWAEKREGGGPGERMAEKLGLSEDQKTKLKAMHEKEAVSRKAQRESMRAAVTALKKGVEGGVKDPELVKLIAGVENARNAMRAQEDKNVQEMKKILTVPQQAKAALFFAHKAQEMKEGGMRKGMEGRRREKREHEHEDEDEDDDGGKEMKK